MIQIHLKIAWRNLYRNKVNSLVNIIGLALGLASVTFIALFINDELKYDQFFDDAQRIYRVNVEGKMGDNEFYAGYTPPPAGAALVENFPEIENYTRIYRPGIVPMESSENDKKRLFNESNIFAVDSNFLKVLSYPLAKGDPATCLTQANSIVITPQIAEKYFGNEDPMGKVLLYGVDKTPMKVTGVLKDMK
ncbi:MAG TPA: ABC transporter permease, partial [Gillisia sp.]|nr:ABC transporter permease [Gillisia sp.]